MSAAEDLKAYQDPSELAEALQRYDEDGKLIPLGKSDVILEFKFERAGDPEGIVSPVGSDWGPGFIPGGKVKGSGI